MKLGDFTKLAQSYRYRTGYSLTVLRYLAPEPIPGAFRVADVGAGTGKLTENLVQIGLRGFAVEPNEAMRAEGIRTLGDDDHFAWSEGAGEVTGLPDASVDWVLMGSSFHWTDRPCALAEFHRILRPGGRFTALWNPRDLASSEFHMGIEAKIREIVPELKRVSSGSRQCTEDLDEVLVSTGHFRDLVFMEAPHAVHATPERYVGAWRSVNDIQAQAGAERFEAIMRMIETEIRGMDAIEVPYRTRAWTVHRVDD
ncbi:MAG: class I SAM-dependent methyltransferase [Planctomycetes bacterium]|nr:class I SAM-dependent methyltransferase [Planctomycetota bacterium]